ncbi:precorrin-2 C20-methyltransferase/precorrin-3B C17-methyltransferase [Dietzia kunjamensis]|uniref:Precorrin-2 C(20)-methyltransferase n=1 Tax=Dietzia maris TaxID=37915 RepID=A0AAE4U880_9ACTN|nr:MULTISPECIES: precorrin-2 C(20)-methyltransferase [Dietzia]MCT1433037.1 precorrin-2 C(20)-methyltransferase [Dietzia maris]MCT1521140.1 precorrin-2 C(20)-methyltransferase [Dietzia maris]MDV6300148.1 precorrin-2 C(20)-methyltransferase [Dietzia maris]MEB8327554.1 precorrin-2 C(20)-methyltransferase [Dietzia kunjamensis]RKE59685.1 precorrin-2 C20-methyltransferase/precorrin-3B C17-methyltransferase [Dietzia kunjamensis]
MSAGSPAAGVAPGRLYGVGVGPGDPELLTLKAARLVGAADVVAFHAGRGKESNARRIAADLIPSGAIQERLEYPVTTGVTDHPGGYAGAIADFYERSAQRLGEHLAAGRDVVLLSEGDPLFYGSFMYMHDRLSPRFETEIVPGIPAFAAATAAAATPLVRQTDVLTVLPGTLPEPELARRLADTDGAIIMKLGRNFPAVRRALEAAGRLDGAVYVERASTDAEAHHPVSEVDPDSVPYFSLIVVPGDSQHSDPTGRRPAQLSAPEEPSPGRTAGSVEEQSPASRGVVHVVGLGPGPTEWLTPEASQILSEVDHVVGYAPYVARVPQRPGLRRHCSGNTVEVDRAALALEVARAGEQVAVVSGGDAGVFGMASAVFEAADDPRFADIDIRVAPGVSAVQAVAARAGAPIGADFAVMSLSDRLKPWEVIERRLDAIAAADLVLAVYNPASRSRTRQVADAREVLLRHRSPTTPVIVGRDVGRTEESLTVTTLADLDCDSVDMKCLLIVGASGTRVTESGRVWSPRFVTS